VRVGVVRAVVMRRCAIALFAGVCAAFKVFGLVVCFGIRFGGNVVFSRWAGGLREGCGLDSVVSYWCVCPSSRSSTSG